MYESDNANFDDMVCTWNERHVIGMMLQSVDVRKPRKIVMKSEIVFNTTC